MFPDRIETDRLLLERLSPETVDINAYHRCCSRHEPGIDAVTEYLPWNPHETVQETAAYLRSLAAQWAAGERAEYVLRPKRGEPDAGDIAGSAGLVVDFDRRVANPAIWLRQRFWGRGYSGERARALLALAFATLDLELVAIPVENGNERSRRAVERYVNAHGGQYEGRVRHSTVRPDGRPIDHHRYTITNAQYDATTVE
jgi:ribosomal-protein-alanine N-acetyltransferase